MAKTRVLGSTSLLLIVAGHVRPQSKKQHLRAELEKVTQARKDLRTQTRDMKAKLAYLTSGSKIDEQARACLGCSRWARGVLRGSLGCQGAEPGLGGTAQIAALESRLSHSSMPLNEEKKTLEDIKKLKASRATCGAYEGRIEQLASDDKLWNDIKEQMGQCDGVLDSITKKQVPRVLGDGSTDSPAGPVAEPGFLINRMRCGRR